MHLHTNIVHTCTPTLSAQHARILVYTAHVNTCLHSTRKYVSTQHTCIPTLSTQHTRIQTMFTQHTCTYKHCLHSTHVYKHCLHSTHVHTVYKAHIYIQTLSTQHPCTYKHCLRHPDDLWHSYSTQKTSLALVERRSLTLFLLLHQTGHHGPQTYRWQTLRHAHHTSWKGTQ